MKRSVIIIGILLLTSALLFLMPKNNDNKIIEYNFIGLTKEEVEEKAIIHNLDITYQYEEKEIGTKEEVIKQRKVNDTYIVTITTEDKDEYYRKYKVNELGNVPIMMYHGIVNEEATYTGGNIDEDGYHRSVEAFKKDLEFYYQNGYRMIRLMDYVNGEIDVALGYSPIVLTFDDGNENNIKVTGLDENGDIIIDENSAVGILESFKEKYPDFSVTATFFINSSLFNQEEYNEKIILWLIEHGYDIGNHSYTHADFSKLDKSTTIGEIGKQYELLESIIEDYVPIVALPFGSPYSKTHPNFKYILSSRYNELEYITESTLRVGWDSELSPYHIDFDKTFLKRIRAYDNNGEEFDIKMVFDNLEETKYISDGMVDMITIPKDEEKNISSIDFSYQTYTLSSN